MQRRSIPCAALLLGACAASRPVPDAPRAASIFTPGEVGVILSMSPLPDPPPDPTNRFADDPRAAALGQAIFFDPRFSARGDVSCATCHDPARSWTDGEPAPSRFDPSARNVPALWNVAYNRWYFWDGRADSLWSQALSPLENPREHAGDRAQYAGLVVNDPALRGAYARTFRAPPDTSTPAGIDAVFVNVAKAIAAYERRLVSRHAPFDVFVEGLRAGDADRMHALSESAQRGLRLFIGPANCTACHHGPNLSDGEFHDTGISMFDRANLRDAGRLGGVSILLTSPFNALGAFSDDPDGRSRHPTSFLVNNTEWRGAFKTPTLRNAALTAPYMHRGQLATLDDVVAFYSDLHPPGVDPVAAAAERDRAERDRRARGGVDPPSHAHSHAGPDPMMRRLGLTPEQAADLVEFLRSLTDTAIDPALTRPLTAEELTRRTR
jgi:cytochrome c peroxidase